MLWRESKLRVEIPDRERERTFVRSPCRSRLHTNRFQGTVVASVREGTVVASVRGDGGGFEWKCELFILLVRVGLSLVALVPNYR